MDAASLLLNGKKKYRSFNGFSPSNGLIMGTRSGDIDHSYAYFLFM
jgi:acetate kinase